MRAHIKFIGAWISVELNRKGHCPVGACFLQIISWHFKVCFLFQDQGPAFKKRKHLSLASLRKLQG